MAARRQKVPEDTSALRELQAADPASLLLAPWGLGRFTPEQAAAYYTELAASFQIPEGIPENTRLAFDRARDVFRYGVLNYDLFTVAGDQAKLSLEQALRDRFVPWSAGSIELRRKLKDTGTAVPISTYDDVLKGVKRVGRHLTLSNGRTVPFDGMLDSLLKWARGEHLLAGQRDRLRDKPRVNLRNIAGHQGYHRSLPDTAASAISDLAAIISQLWGTPPAPVTRHPCIVAWNNRGVTSGYAKYFTGGALRDGGDPIHVVVRAAERTDLHSYDSLHETTPLPAEYLWGPGTVSEATSWVQTNNPGSDTVTIHDRIFAIRRDGIRLYLPQAVPVLAGLPPDRQAGTWYVLRADRPDDAYNHQRQVISAQAGEAAPDHQNTPGQCTCPVEVLGEGTWNDAITISARHGADTQPITPPDLRVTISWTPRWMAKAPGGWINPHPPAP